MPLSLYYLRNFKDCATAVPFSINAMIAVACLPLSRSALRISISGVSGADRSPSPYIPPSIPTAPAPAQPMTLPMKVRTSQKNAGDSRRIMCVFSFVGSTIFEPKQTLPLWMYMVIGGSVCGAVVSVILLIGIVSLCKKHKQRKQMQRVFKVGC